MEFRAVREGQRFGDARGACLTAHVNPQNGATTLGFIDSALVEYVIDDPDNSMKPVAVVLKKIRGEQKRRAYKIIDVSDNPTGVSAGRLTGLPVTDEEKEEYKFEYKLGDSFQPKEFSLSNQLRAEWRGSCFFFTVNNALSSNRGWSDLLPNLDWIDAHDQFLFSQ